MGERGTIKGHGCVVIMVWQLCVAVVGGHGLLHGGCVV
jgi:hypothetical protein